MSNKHKVVVTGGPSEYKVTVTLNGEVVRSLCCVRYSSSAARNEARVLREAIKSFRCDDCGGEVTPRRVSEASYCSHDLCATCIEARGRRQMDWWLYGGSVGSVHSARKVVFRPKK